MKPHVGTRDEDMARLTVATRKQVIILKRRGYSFLAIQRRLLEEDIQVSLRSLQRPGMRARAFAAVCDHAYGQPARSSTIHSDRARVLSSARDPRSGVGASAFRVLFERSLPSSRALAL